MQACQTKHAKKHRHANKYSLYSSTSAKQTDATQAKSPLASRLLTRTQFREKAMPGETGHGHLTERSKVRLQTHQKRVGTHTHTHTTHRPGAQGVLSRITARRKVSPPSHCKGEPNPAGLRLNAAAAPARGTQRRGPRPSPPPGPEIRGSPKAVRSPPAARAATSTRPRRLPGLLRLYRASMAAGTARSLRSSSGSGGRGRRRKAGPGPARLASGHSPDVAAAATAPP